MQLISCTCLYSIIPEQSAIDSKGIVAANKSFPLKLR